MDCLNRKTGPPDSAIASYEALTGHKPKVLPILPYGCKAFAVKPRPAFSKTEIEPRAWVGINLGRASHTPGAYNIWLPRELKLVCTSEVFFDEGLMPWRPKGDQRIGDPLPSEATLDIDQPPGVPPSVDTAPRLPSQPADSLPEAFDAATRTGADARCSTKVLILFSGPYRRPDGLAVFLS